MGDMSNDLLLTRADLTMLMHFALGEAERGLAHQEIPIGCVAAALSERGLRILARAYETSAPGGHAVATVLAAALSKLRPHDGGLFVVSTVEPCAACIERCRASSTRELIYGLSQVTRSGERRLSLDSGAEMPLVGGISAAESRQLLQTFVQRRVGLPRAITYVEELLRGTSHAA
jgi:tRNA(Arg) A34 adenosine deaminase TadA